jgi:signal peptidase I
MITYGFLFSAILMRLLTFSPFIVAGGSMLPTLHDGEVFVLDEGVFLSSEPKRGDVVVFADSKKPDYLYIKRVIGLPGERLHVTNDGIFVEENGAKKELTESYLAHAEDQSKNYSRAGYRDEIYVVPSDKYFVLGDNRGRSLDSRSFTYPFIPKSMIKGKYLFTIM